jgi:CelD/BcsL family acetyltransferase involved in cellulose biosynthesis
MVDAAASSEAGNRAAGSARPRKGDSAVLKATVHLNVTDAIEAYRSACRGAVLSPAQSFAWVSAWVAQTRPDFLVARLALEQSNVLAVALEVTQSGLCRVARFVSGRHANGNFPPVARKGLRNVTPDDLLDVLATAIRRARPDIDMLAFERMAERLDGQENPLLCLPHSPSANLSLAVDLAGGFDALLGRVSGKRKRKKHRSQARKFEAAGGFRLVEAKTSTEANALLDAFFVMKEERFRKMGVANVFGEPAVQSFFRALFADALKTKEPAFTLHGLEVGGKLRAVTGSSRTSRRLICEFGSIAEDDLAHTSPGDFLFFENIREACERGFDIYDFSVGDEPYKRLWCDLETTQFDVFIPLSAKGRLLAGAMRGASRLKSFVKNRPIVWRVAKALRKRSGASASSQDD